MTDRECLLRAVLASPDDDAPRLAFADEIQESEPERAEWIRDQIEYARTAPGPAELADFFVLSVEAFDGKAYLIESIAKPLPKWIREVISPVSWAGSWTFRRGFIECLSIPAADWLVCGDSILAAHPVTEVRLATLPEVEVSFGPFDARPERGETHPTCIANLRGINKPMAVPHDDRLAAEALLRHVWPSVRTWHLPEPGVTLQARHLFSQIAVTPELLADNRIMTGDPDVPRPQGVIEAETAESPSAAPPESARRRRGQSRMPAWLAEQRSRRPSRPR